MAFIRTKNTFVHVCEHDWDCEAARSALKRSSSDPGLFCSPSSSLAGSEPDGIFCSPSSSSVGSDPDTLGSPWQVERTPSACGTTDDADESPCHFFPSQTHEGGLPPFPSPKSVETESTCTTVKYTDNARSVVCTAMNSAHAFAALGTTPLRLASLIQPDASLEPYSNCPSCETRVGPDLQFAVSGQRTVVRLHNLARESTTSVMGNTEDAAGFKGFGIAALRPNAATSIDQRTTVMLRNLPHNYTSLTMMRKMDAAGFRGKYDFLYLPMDFKAPTNLGFCFVNMTDPAHVSPFWAYFDGYSKWGGPSKNKCSVTWSSKLQGLEANIERYRNSPVMDESVPEGYKPRVFRDGVQIPFPPPSLKLKAVQNLAPQMPLRAKEPLSLPEKTGSAETAQLFVLANAGSAQTAPERKKQKKKKTSGRKASMMAVGTMPAVRGVVDAVTGATHERFSAR
eukprot:TRINITY_DN3389_c1_g1_i1.p1 TRINITY_DN3389_c1_g1~~TRINITY_DN3389_c1_g1_i1.p1  ORF type:complete len:453 (+),score=59.14 TRINITY_DN3389_c1_g1_i1:60-1418(+)